MAAVVAFAGAATARAQSLSIEQIPNPRNQGGWVSDMAEVLSADELDGLNAMIEALEKKISVEVAVVTVQNVDGVPKDFATALFNHWGIGKAKANNGLLLLLVMAQRRLEMETGYGLEPLLPDGWLGTMQSQSMVPLFKEGKYGGGLIAGMAAVVHRLLQEPGAAEAGVMVPFAEASAEPETKVLWPLVALALAGVAAGGWFWRRKWQRTCPTCKTSLKSLDEVAEDEHLDSGQLTEEAIGSMNHEVLRCETCGFLRMLSHFKFFTHYERCSGCGYKTQHSDRTVLIAPTTATYGSMHVTETCRHCFHTRSYTNVIPMKPSGSSSTSGFRGSGGSGSSGGGFGGGRSGGGGAGSSW